MKSKQTLSLADTIRARGRAQWRADQLASAIALGGGKVSGDSMPCPKCGTDNDVSKIDLRGPAFCGQCGSSMNGIAAPDDEDADDLAEVPCQSCGGRIDMRNADKSSALECPHCSASIPGTGGDDSDSNLDDSDDPLSSVPSDSEAVDKTLRGRSIASRDASGAPVNIRDIRLTASEKRRLSAVLDEIQQRRRGTSPIW